MPLFDMTSFANVCMCEMQPLVKHGCFKVCDTLKIIEDVGFHVFKALKKDDITCVFNGTSFFNSSNNSSTLQWEQRTIHQPSY
jgi:hypothetical protein